MNKKNLSVVALLVSVGVVVGLLFFQGNMLFLNAQRKFLNISSFIAESTDKNGTVEKTLYKRPNYYKVVDQNGKLKFLFANGVFLYVSGENSMKKIDTNILTETELKRFYTQIPPFTGIFYQGLSGNKVTFKGTEIAEGEKVLHFFVSRAVGMGALKIDFWVDKNTGVLVKYIDQDGHSDSWDNFRIDVPIEYSEFTLPSESNGEIEDLTFHFKRDDEDDGNSEDQD
jgi:hypothetical protein